MVVSASAPVAPIPSAQLLIYLLQVGALLLLALLLGQLAERLRMPALVGELAAGVVLGPSLFGALAPHAANRLFPRDPGQFHLLDACGQIGLLLMVGLAAMHVDLGLIRRRAGTAAGVGAAGLLVPLGLGVATGYLVPAQFVPAHIDRLVFALFVGVALSVSAIPVIAKTLMDMNLLHRNVGQLTLIAGMIDDIAGWLLLSVVAAAATTGFRSGSLARSVLGLAAILLLCAVAGRPLMRAAFRLAGRSPGQGPTTALCVAVLILMAALTQSLGLEAAVGAFIAGLLINASGVAPARLSGLRTMVTGVLAPIYFATAGLRMDLTRLGRPSILAVAVTMLAVAVVGKFVGAFCGARLSRVGRWEALAIGAGLNARGVVEVTVATVGLQADVLTTDTYTIIILIAIATSLMAPPVLRLSMARVENTSEESLREENFRAAPEVAPMESRLLP